MATFDALDLAEILPSGPHPEWLLRLYELDQYVVDVPLWSKRINNDPYGVKMLMAYPDALAPLLDASQLLKIWSNHKLLYPHFLISLPKSRQHEILSVIFNEAKRKTAAYRRGEDPSLDEVLERMNDTYKEAFMHILPAGETLERRVMKWLMTS